jgi:RNA polymerase sigma-70 factor (ECF subfamily)
MTERDEIEDLVDRVKGGDPAALGALYDRLADRVYRFSLFRVGNHADAEDLTQRTFLKMIEALPRYQRRGIPFEAWLFRLARNAAIDLMRGRRTNESLESASELRSEAPGPEAAAEQAAELAAARRAIEQLTDDQREVISYRFAAGLTPREIGLLMGRREGTIRALQFRALNAMRRYLHAEETPRPPSRGEPERRR